jgi:hypothetical protein
MRRPRQEPSVVFRAYDHTWETHLGADARVGFKLFHSLQVGGNLYVLDLSDAELRASGLLLT